MRALLLLLCLLLADLAARAEDFDRVELIPGDRAGYTLANFFAPITTLFMGGPSYWYSRREFTVRSTPPGAALDLFYVRRNFQKAFVQADAPAIVVLPSRNEAGSHDTLKIRASLDGYRQKEMSFKVRSGEKEVTIQLEPLANSLMAVTHLYFAGRARLGFLTKEALTFRTQRNGDEYDLILLETGNTPEATEAMSVVQDALVDSLRPQQLGQDLVIRIATTGDVELRSGQSYDAVRRLHEFNLDLLPRQGQGGSPVQRARQALARIDYPRVSGCALRFEAALRAQLDAAALARALTPQGSFTDPYLRAALKRLGEISPGGSVVLADGTRYRTAAPLELAAASSQAGDVQGYLAMLRAFVAELEPPAQRRQTLRGLIAPELAPSEFDAAVDAGEAAERSCRAAAR